MKNIYYEKFVYSVLIMVLSGMAFIITVNFVVDPFNLNGIFNLGFRKDIISYKANYRLYKMIAFKKNPSQNILLGDSRTDHLDPQLIKKITGEDYFNFAYGGGTLYEAIETFWYAANIKKLKNVCIGINFNLYNKYNHMSLVPEATTLITKPLQYYFSPFTTKVSYYNIVFWLSGKNMRNEKPNISKKEFWQEQLGSTTRRFYVNYQYPSDIYADLRKIKKYCNIHGINLVFFIPPTHVDLQAKVGEYKLSDAYIQFKRDLCSITKTIDYDYPNVWTKNSNFFKDPYHFNELVMEKLINEVWREKYYVGKILQAK